ncbi:hypothetical protein GQ457_18G006010 [Hibiscus cannabinus]
MNPRNKHIGIPKHEKLEKRCDLNWNEDLPAIKEVDEGIIKALEFIDFVAKKRGGKEQYERAVKALKEGGHVLTIYSAVVPPATLFLLTLDGAILEKLEPFLESGKVKPIIDPKSIFSFAQTPQVFTYLEIGRVVLRGCAIG